MINNAINVPGRLHSFETGNVLVGANEVLDDSFKWLGADTERASVKQDIINARIVGELERLGTLLQLPLISVQVVDALPQTGETNVVYLLKNPSDTSNTLFTEYVYVNQVVDGQQTGSWRNLGSQTLDLEGYVTSADLNDFKETEVDPISQKVDGYDSRIESLEVWRNTNPGGSIIDLDYVFDPQSENAATSKAIAEYFGDNGSGSCDCKEDIDLLKAKVNTLLGEKTSVSFTASDKLIYVSTNPATKNITFTLTSSPEKSNMQFWEEGSSDVGLASETNTAQFTRNITVSSPIKKKYNASFNINGVSKSSSIYVEVVRPMFYGAGTDDDSTVVFKEIAGPKSSIAGTYDITLENDKSHIFFKLQSDKFIGSVYTVGDVSFKVDMESPVVKDGFNIYRSVSTFDKGTYSFKVS